MSCLHCVYFACWTSGHMNDHNLETGHPLSVENDTLSIYCSLCGDVVYDRDMELVASTECTAAQVFKMRLTGGERSHQKCSDGDGSVQQKYDCIQRVAPFECGGKESVP